MQDIVLNLNYPQEDIIKAIVHPFYTPGFVLSDFWLFSCLKDKLDTYSDA